MAENKKAEGLIYKNHPLRRLNITFRKYFQP